MTCEAQFPSASSYLLRTDLGEAAAAGQLSAAASGSGKDCSRGEGRRGACHCIQGALCHFPSSEPLLQTLRLTSSVLPPQPQLAMRKEARHSLQHRETLSPTQRRGGRRHGQGLAAHDTERSPPPAARPRATGRAAGHGHRGRG